jgi:hypothetical protein
MRTFSAENDLLSQKKYGIPQSPTPYRQFVISSISGHDFADLEMQIMHRTTL